MKIQYCSDLHIEFSENKKYLKENPLIPVGDILILAGDVVPFALMNEHEDFFDYLSDHFALTYWLPGNHEYYHSDLTDRCDSLHEKIRSNVLLVNNYQVTHEDVRFIFSTLWTHLSVENQWRIQQALSDFQVINYKNERLTPNKYNDQHALGLTYISQQMEHTVGKTVVVTHHVPTFLNYPMKYKGDILNEAFAVELYDLIEPSGVKYWIYGHHHQNVSPFVIGVTNIITNQLGYVRHNEHFEFFNNKYINFM